MAAFSLIRRGYPGKVRNATVKSMNFPKPFQSFVFELLLSFENKSLDNRSNDFLFHIFHSVKIFNSLGK